MRRFVLGFLAFLLLAAPQALSAQGARVTVIHGISGGALGLTPSLPVDVWANGAPLLTDFTFGETAGPLTLAAGTYQLRVYLAGSNPATTTPVLSLDAALANGQDVHIVAHLTPGPGIALTPFFNNNTPQIEDPVSSRISERTVRLTIRHGADFPRVALNRLVTAFEPTLANRDTLSLDLSPGHYRFWLSAAGAGRPLSSQPTQLDLEAGTHYYAYAVGSPSDDSFQLVVLTDDLP